MPFGSETFSTVPTKSYARAEKTSNGKDKSKRSIMREAILLEVCSFILSLWPRELFSDFAVSKIIMSNIHSSIFKFILCLRDQAGGGANGQGAIILPSQAKRGRPDVILMHHSRRRL
ncbi:MAG: hypothetical protein PHW87_07175 [Methanothrix sp.]|nr:hypothetical protein [Methanothrix sp.]